VFIENGRMGWPFLPTPWGRPLSSCYLIFFSAAPPHATSRAAVLLCPCRRGGGEGARWRGRQSTSSAWAGGRGGQAPQAWSRHTVGEQAVLRCHRQGGHQAHNTHTWTQRRLSSRYGRVPDEGGTARDVGSWWRRRRRVDVGGLRATR